MNTHVNRDKFEYRSEPVVGYGMGLIVTNRTPKRTSSGNLKFYDGKRAYDVHPYRADLGGYPVRWYDDIAQTCEVCGGPVKEYSLDFMVGTTVYDQLGEIQGTMENVPPEVEQDYLIVCRHCIPGVVESWNGMVYKLKSQGA